jgi:hypothetical protein
VTGLSRLGKSALESLPLILDPGVLLLCFRALPVNISKQKRIQEAAIRHQLRVHHRPVLPKTRLVRFVLQRK